MAIFCFEVPDCIPYLKFHSVMMLWKFNFHCRLSFVVQFPLWRDKIIIVIITASLKSSGMSVRVGKMSKRSRWQFRQPRVMDIWYLKLLIIDFHRSYERLSSILKLSNDSKNFFQQRDLRWKRSTFLKFPKPLRLSCDKTLNNELGIKK